jgi:hypothetical protein
MYKGGRKNKTLKGKKQMKKSKANRKNKTQKNGMKMKIKRGGALSFSFLPTTDPISSANTLSGTTHAYNIISASNVNSPPSYPLQTIIENPLV